MGLLLFYFSFLKSYFRSTLTIVLPILLTQSLLCCFFFKKWHMYAPNHTDNEEIRKKVIIYKQEVEMYLSGKALALQAQSNEFHP